MRTEGRIWAPAKALLFLGTLSHSQIDVPPVAKVLVRRCRKTACFSAGVLMGHSLQEAKTASLRGGSLPAVPFTQTTPACSLPPPSLQCLRAGAAHSQEGRQMILVAGIVLIFPFLSPFFLITCQHPCLQQSSLHLLCP